jgi:magnesium/cobalt transport protein CorA
VASAATRQAAGRTSPDSEVDGLARARLYDATGRDRDVRLTREAVRGVAERQLLWVDVDSRDAAQFAPIAAALEIPEEFAAHIVEDQGRAMLVRYKTGLHLIVQAIEPPDRRRSSKYVRRELDILARKNVVVTVHDGPIAALDRLQDEVSGDTLLGRLDAGSFVEAIVDTVLTTYFALIEDIERDIDELDETALRGPASESFLHDVLRVRRRVAQLRRTIAPHREALAPLARSDAAIGDVLGHELPSLYARLERVIDAVENARELLVGSFDIYLGGAAQRTNDVMKALTILSAVLLPAIVLAGVMGMNFHMPFFDIADNFWVVLAAMGVFAVVILGAARWRHWI